MGRKGYSKITSETMVFDNAKYIRELRKLIFSDGRVYIYNKIKHIWELKKK